MDLTKKVAVISGGASGMGAATARLLAKQGVKVALLDRDLSKAQVLAQDLGGIALECDVTDEACMEAAIATVDAEYGGVHIAVSCAGIAPAARTVGRNGPMPLEAFRQVIDVNLVGTFNLVRIAATQMTRQQPINDDGERGVIINTASVAAFEGQIGQAAYSASKGGVVAMTLPIARELSQFGVRIMTIAPGLIATPMMQGLSEQVQQSLADSVPYPKRLGRSEEFAGLVQHIIENSYLNGSVIRLDAAIRLKEK